VLVGLPLTAAKMLINWPNVPRRLARHPGADIVLLLMAVRLFERETILTRWSREQG